MEAFAKYKPRAMIKETTGGARIKEGHNTIITVLEGTQIKFSLEQIYIAKKHYFQGGQIIMQFVTHKREVNHSPQNYFIFLL